MNTFKQICKKNWYVIATTLLLVICSEVLVGIMIHDSFIYSYGPYEFYGRIALRFLALVGGCLITYYISGSLDSKRSLSIAVISLVGCLFYADSELNCYIPVGYGFFAFCYITATVSLAFYYVNHCRNSAKNTVRYMLMIIILALLTYEEAEFYTVLAIHIFLVSASHKSIEKSSVKILNLISAVISSAAFIGVLVSQIADGMNYKHPDEKEALVLLGKMMSTLKPFGKSEAFDEVIRNGYVSNVFEIFGCYGYVVGIAMIILFMLFTASIFVGCFRSQGESKLAVQIAAITLAIRAFASLLEVFGIVRFFESSMMIVSLNIGECATAGVIIGIIIAAGEEKFLKGNRANQADENILTENASVLDIHTKGEYPSDALSNFSEYEFYVDGVKCASMEGFLQSLKFRSIAKQKQVCLLSGSEAKNSSRRSFAQLRWKVTHTLYWKGNAINRFSDEYQKLLDRAYSSLSGNEEFEKALKSSVGSVLVHSIGERNAWKTILTEYEFVSRLERARQIIINSGEGYDV